MKYCISINLRDWVCHNSVSGHLIIKRNTTISVQLEFRKMNSNPRLKFSNQRKFDIMVNKFPQIHIHNFSVNVIQ
jgi:hypothetical protein